MKYHILKHLHTIDTHRWFVFKNCCKCGFFLRGLVHDLSKYSPSEFFPSAKYYKGTGSPVFRQRFDEGLYSSIAVHHTNRNPHHFEYREDEYLGNIVVKKMPYKYSVEYVCDVIAASMVYLKKGFSKEKPYDFFVTRSKWYFMHPMTREFITNLLKIYSIEEFKGLKKKTTKKLYQDLSSLYKDTCILYFYKDKKKFDFIELDENVDPTNI